MKFKNVKDGGVFWLQSVKPKKGDAGLWGLV